MTIPMAMLALLHDTPQHGFALKGRYDDLLGQDRELTAGQVYSTLARLEQDGLCEGVRFEKGSAADRRMYAITADGLAEIETWVATPQLRSGRPTQLFTKVVLSIVVGTDGESVIEAYRREYLRRMREITAARRGADTIERLVGDDEIAHLQADLQWIDIASARLGDPVAAITLDHRREQRRPLAALAMLGTPGRVIRCSVRLQFVIPLVAGITLAVGAGTRSGAAYLDIAAVDLALIPWAQLVVLGAGAGVIATGTAWSVLSRSQPPMPRPMK